MFSIGTRYSSTVRTCRRYADWASPAPVPQAPVPIGVLQFRAPSSIVSSGDPHAASRCQLAFRREGDRWLLLSSAGSGDECKTTSSRFARVRLV